MTFLETMRHKWFSLHLLLQRQMAQGRDAAYATASKVMVDNLALKDGQEGIRAFIEKRRPVWSHTAEKAHDWQILAPGFQSELFNVRSQLRVWLPYWQHRNYLDPLFLFLQLWWGDEGHPGESFKYKELVKGKREGMVYDIDVHLK